MTADSGWASLWELGAGYRLQRSRRGREGYGCLPSCLLGCWDLEARMTGAGFWWELSWPSSYKVDKQRQTVLHHALEGVCVCQKNKGGVTISPLTVDDSVVALFSWEGPPATPQHLSSHPLYFVSSLLMLSSSRKKIILSKPCHPMTLFFVQLR